MVDRMTEEQAAALLEHIDELGRKLNLADSQAKKNRDLTKWLIGATALLVAVILALGWASWELRDQAQAADDAQFTNCQNANSTREGQRYLWDTLIAQSFARNPDATPAERRYLTDFQEFIHQIFAARDCSDLTKKYELPEPPHVPRPRAD